MLMELGWITAKGSRPHPRISDSSLRSEEELYTLRRNLLQARKHPEAFIATVFRGEDKIWLDRCASIIRDR